MQPTVQPRDSGFNANEPVNADSQTRCDYTQKHMTPSRARIPALLLIASCVFVLVVACAGASPIIQNPTPSSCSNFSNPAKLENAQVKDGAGKTRDFQVLISQKFDPKRLTPVVFVFHGNGGNIDASKSFGFQDAINTAGDQGIVIIPQGIQFENYGIGWNQHSDGYDMPFFDAMLTYLENHYCIDKTRVFSTGFSWGADMTNALACVKGDQLRGVAPFSGAETDYNPTCSTKKYPAVRFRYGSASGDKGDGAYTLKQFQDTTLFYRNAHGCSTVSNPFPPVPCILYQGCGQPVVECRFVSMGHQAPAADEALEVWEFWKSLP
jgi:polyhydroxybutyrate depolymerase